MATALPEGCWPTMITPYNAQGKIDYPVLKALIGIPTVSLSRAHVLVCARARACACVRSVVWAGAAVPRYTSTAAGTDRQLRYRCCCCAAAATEWYIASGCSGLFAVCQSSEMYFLSEEERLELAEFVSKQVAVRPLPPPLPV